VNELIEKYAIIMALGNNGGEWATHYTDKKKYIGVYSVELEHVPVFHAVEVKEKE
jgi:hypothetical protein